MIFLKEAINGYDDKMEIEETINSVREYGINRKNGKIE
jgi:hypothetical protein